MSLGGLLLPAAIGAAVAASPLRPASLREAGLVLVGIVLAVAASSNRSKRGYRRSRRAVSDKSDSDSDSDETKHIIRTIEELREVLPAGASGTCLEDAKKVINCLDDQMIQFIAKSPLLYLATFDTITKAPFVSPKGDNPGFVKVLSKRTKNSPKHTLVIPDRPGNRLLFGLQNIVVQSDTENERKSETNTNSTPTIIKDSKVSVLFEVPRTGTTLRCGGTARLSTDPALLKTNEARGCPPKLVILVDVDHAFFHCAKAYMRSRVWDPTSWPSEPLKVTFGRYFAKKESILANTIDSNVDKHYQQIQKAIDGEDCEKEA